MSSANEIYKQDSPSPLPNTSHSVDSFAHGTEDFAFGRTVVPVPLRNKPKKAGSLPNYEYREHSYIGDAINLKLSASSDDTAVPAKDHKFSFPNGLQLTYGEINGLSGDFYGTTDAISDGTTFQDQQTRFLAAYKELSERASTPAEAKEILAVLQTEIDKVNQALAEGKDPSTAYGALPSVNGDLQKVTMKYRALEPQYPAYFKLSQTNWDHFGPDARTAYNAGHAVALETAASGDLLTAYMQNAFCDHFLEDSFAAGHMRTPRRAMHNWNSTADLCAKYMHDEDNAIGLKVSRPDGESWTCYGDKRALDKVARDCYTRCVEAVQASADEIYFTWKDKVVPTPDQYKVWTLAPTLESALAPQTLAAFFRHKEPLTWSGPVQRRVEIKNRHDDKRASDWSWTYPTTALDCENNGWWKYPILIDGP